MVAKKKDDIMTEEPINQNVENVVPTYFFKNFDEFFMDYAKRNNIDLKWKEPVVLHAKSMKMFEDATKWEMCCKHFGI